MEFLENKVVKLDRLYNDFAFENPINTVDKFGFLIAGTGIKVHRDLARPSGLPIIVKDLDAMFRVGKLTWTNAFSVGEPCEDVKGNAIYPVQFYLIPNELVERAYSEGYVIDKKLKLP